MYVLRIEHRVPDYHGWKSAFDSDPIGRQNGGVRAHRILWKAGDPTYVYIDLEFDDGPTAEAVQAQLLELWQRVDVARDPQVTAAELVEAHLY